MSGPTAQFVRDAISQDRVVIFSKSYCPYCRMAKDVFDKLKKNYTTIELDSRDDADQIQSVLNEITGARTITLNRKNMARVHRIIGQGVYDYNEDTPVVIEEIAIKAKYNCLIRWAKIIIPSMSMLGGIILLLIGPLIDSTVGVEKKTGMENLVNYDLPIPFWMPFDSTGPYTYWLSVILLALTVNTSIFVFISFNTVYFTVCLHIACQLEILILSVKNIELRAKTYFTRNNQSDKKEIHIEGLYKDKDFIKMFEACLKKNIQHHQVILRLFRTAADIFYNPIFTFYFLVGFMIALASCAAISVTGQPGGVLNFVDIAVIQLLNVAVTCKMGQKLTDLNTQFRMELYSTNWYQYDKTITSLIIIIQEFTYRDMVIEAPFNFAANMETLAAKNLSPKICLVDATLTQARFAQGLLKE